MKFPNIAVYMTLSVWCNDSEDKVGSDQRSIEGTSQSLATPCEIWKVFCLLMARSLRLMIWDGKDSRYNL